jgi:hypothetical protein
MLRSFPPELGYDFDAHWEYAEWIRRDWTIPRLEDHRLANHPPLYYALLAGLMNLGGGPAAAQAISVAAGLVRLAVVWFALERWFPHDHVARRIALALAAVLPVSVLLDGTVSGETVCATLVMLALVFVPMAFTTGGRGIVSGAVLGLLLGIAALVKVSAVTLLGAFGAAVLARFVLDGRDGWPGRVRRLGPWIAALVMFLGVTGWYFAWNRAIYGKPIVTFFDTPGLRYMPATLIMPVYFRRPPEFYLGWSAEIHAYPYFPSASLDRSRFFPQLVASTFVDYYNHQFAAPRSGVSEIVVNARPLPAPALGLGRASMLAGTLIAAVTMVAWAVASARAWTARDWVTVALLLVPLTGVAAQAYYAHLYPHDWLAVIKGAYVLYAMPPLYAVFGLGTAWLARRSTILALVSVAAVVTVGVYTVWCRAV